MNCNETPLEDLMNDALRRYNESARIMNHWSDDIPKAIKFYYLFKINNPPSQKQKNMKVKKERAKMLREMGYSIREIMKIMNYKSPRSISDLLKDN